MEQGWRLTPESLSPPGRNLQEMITSLKAEVESHKQELQAGKRPSGRGCGEVWAGLSDWRVGDGSSHRVLSALPSSP